MILAAHRGLLMGGAPAGPSIPSADVVALLRFDGSGASFIDSGPNGLTVTAGGSATQVTRSGAFGKAMETSGQSDHANIAGNSVFSLSTWSVNVRFDPGVNPTSISCALLDIDGFSSGISIRQNFSSGNITLFHNGNQRDVVHALAVDTPAEVEVCYGSGTVYVFTHGVLRYSGAATITFGSTPALRVAGCLEGGATSTDTRYIDEVLITNTVLHTATYTERTGAYVIV